jgi:hypothetical protein
MASEKRRASLPDRRTVLGGALAIVALPSHGWSADSPFATLSAALVGAANVDPDLATSYEAALRAGPTAAALERLISLASNFAGTALLEQIDSRGLQSDAGIVVAAWYSGMVDGKVVTYTGALAWNAVPFTKPNGYCGGAFGYWSDPPAS